MEQNILNTVIQIITANNVDIRLGLCRRLWSNINRTFIQLGIILTGRYCPGRLDKNLLIAQKVFHNRIGLVSEPAQLRGSDLVRLVNQSLQIEAAPY